SPLRVDLDRYKIPREIITTQRIGVNMRGKDGAKPQRFFVAGNPYVSGMCKRTMDRQKHGWKD
ncbi:MAG: 3-methyladenine DNA glycosylase, partial [Limosilactobacillus sp.]